ncbi:5'-methylthioadenosine/S-adenosylhomocysteine nucleosidase [Candidatus Latescibacterota bacterium]
MVIPMQEEIDCFLQGCADYGGQAEDSAIGRLPAVRFPDFGITIARGGLGKVQFAVQTQHLLDTCPDWDLVICSGAAGALVDDLSVGDVVVSTETVEHDINNKFGEPLLPRFSGNETAIYGLRCMLPAFDSFRVHFGPIASGDEDVIDTERRKVLHRLTGALAVAWEGVGGARACHFSNVSFIEIRGVTDGANSKAASDFEENLKSTMKNVATLIVSWTRDLHT